jgi:Protein of unknown function (DUF3224)
MSTHAEGKFKVKSWDEDTYAELGDGRKLTRASVKQGFSGDVEGEGAVEWLMCYRPDETADFVGLQQVDGRVGDRSGSFVLQNSGTFDGREARGEWSVVPGSATGDLTGLRGEGQFTAPLGGEPSLTLEYDFE